MTSQAALQIASCERRMAIRVDHWQDSVLAICPYASSFSDFAHNRRAKWSDALKGWLFDRRDEVAVHGTMIDIYGTDDYASCEKVDVRIDLDGWKTNSTRIFTCGREVAFRPLYQKPVRLGDGVILITGGFADHSEGCHPRICEALPGTVLEVRDVPVLAAAKCLKAHPDHAEIVGSNVRELLLQEREILERRIETIDGLLSAMANMSTNADTEIIADLRDE